MKIKNPIITELSRSADPFITFYGGKYYHCYGNVNGLFIECADTIENLDKAEAICIRTGGDWYAPELHKIGDRWYVYGAPQEPEWNTHTMAVMVSQGDDPMGPYEFKGMVGGLENQFAIDATILEYNGKHYMVWSTNKLFIAEMSDPLNLTGEHYLLAEPVEPWEKVLYPIAEAPCVIKKDGKIHIVYSASDSQCDDYCLALLTFNGEDILDRNCWTKSSKPLFTKSEGEIYGPGHCSFTQCVDGEKTVDIIVFHANTVSGSGWRGRKVFIQPVTYKDGYPIFGNSHPQFCVEI